jgi:hypothetical protein
MNVSKPIAIVTVLALIASFVGLATMSFQVQQSALPDLESAPSSQGDELEFEAVSVEPPGIYTPPVVAARSAKLSEEEIVVGVRVLNTARAYVLNALKAADGEVIHDEIDGHQISVEHTLTESGMYLAVHWEDGLEYVEHLFEITTWNAWKKQHPTTDVYVGQEERQQPSRSTEPMPKAAEHDDQVIPS